MISIAPESVRRTKTMKKLSLKIKNKITTNNNNNNTGKEDRCKNLNAFMAGSVLTAQPAAKGMCLPASATLEAALVFPIVLYALCAVMYLMQIVGIQVHIQEALYNEARLLAKYSYAADCVQKGLAVGETVTADDDMSGLLSNGMSIGTAYGLFLQQVGSDYAGKAHIVGGNGGYVFLESSLGGHDIELVVTYVVENPFDIFGIGKSKYTQKAYAKSWVGDDGSSQGGASDGGDNSSNAGAYVYVAGDSQVYHDTSACTYLTPSVSTVGAGQVAASRNSQGGKYYPCEYCTGSGSGCSVYYITNYGDRYHSTSECSRLKRSYTLVPRESAGGLRQCTRCGGNR